MDRRPVLVGITIIHDMDWWLPVMILDRAGREDWQRRYDLKTKSKREAWQQARAIANRTRSVVLR